jgi:hypothetical protein
MATPQEILHADVVSETPHIPEQRFPPNLKKTILLLLLLIGSFLYLSWGAGVGIRLFDEGNFVYGAARILEGELPYRDFFTIYFPGQFYILALIFKVFGNFLIAGRLFSTACYAFIGILGFLIAEKLANLKLASFSWLLIVLWFGAFGFIHLNTPIPTALVFSLASLLLFMKFLQSFQKRYLFFAGVLAGISAFFRQDAGLYTMLAEAGAGIPFVYFSFSGEHKFSTATYRSLLTLLTHAIGVSVILLPLAIFFLMKVPADQLYFSFIQWPLQIWPNYGSLPYPAPLENPALLLSGQRAPGPYFLTGLMRVPYYFPVVVLLLALLVLAVPALRKRLRTAWGMLLIFIFGLTSFNLARGRSDIAHLLLVAISAAILVSPLLAATLESMRRLHRTFLLLVIGMILLFAFSSLIFYISKSIPPSKKLLASPQLHPARGIYLLPSSARPLEQAAQFVRSQTAEDARIFVGNVRHDQGTINDIMFYFLAERASATKYFALAPGLITAANVQREIVGDLKRYHVNYIVIWTRSQRYLTPQESEGVTILDDFIRTHYRPIRKFGEYIILCKKPSVSLRH